MEKSTPAEIRSRFDGDVERFANLETGQSATIDAPLVLELITAAAAAVTPHATHMLDIGCGAGNYTLKMLQKISQLNCTLIDLSAPMLERAMSRISQDNGSVTKAMCGDIREIDLGSKQFDVVLAAAVLHHLRTDGEWERVFRKIHTCLRPGGSFWISDLVEHQTPAVHNLMQQRYGDYLTRLKSEAYRDQVFAYIKKEDTPRPLGFQLDLMRHVGFSQVEVLHKSSVFAAFGGIKF